jgi:hypothetical protein
MISKKTSLLMFITILFDASHELDGKAIVALTFKYNHAWTFK